MDCITNKLPEEQLNAAEAETVWNKGIDNDFSLAAAKESRIK